MTYFPNLNLADGPSLDAFARQRMSEPYTLFDSKQIYDNQPLFWDEELESGAGISSAHDPDTASTVITSTVSTAGTFTRQTFQSFNYQPGKSQLVFMTAVLDKSGGGAGTKRRLGYFNDDNGLFFEDNEGTVNVTRRSNATGTPVDTAVNQASWNIDVMDGSGPSGITVDWTTMQIFMIDFTWLGTGRTRFGLVIDGEVFYVHEILNANNLSVVYMSTPNLPLRFQMITTGTSAATELECICATVISEGGQEPLGVTRYASTDGTHVDCATENVWYAILGLRKKTSYIGAHIDLIAATLVEGAGNKLVEWSLFFNPSVAGTFTYSGITNSALEKATGATANTVSGGYQIAGGHLGSGVKGGEAGGTLQSAVRLGSSISGVVDEVVLCAQPIAGTANIDIEGGLEWREMP